jgi:cation-transporting P-type ATPase I
VIGTCAGTFLALAALVTTPGLSQLVGCVPLGPLAWMEAVAPAVALTVLTAAKPDLLLQMSSTIAAAVSKYATKADRRVTNAVESLSTWAQELPGAASDPTDDWQWEPHLDLRPAS